MSRQNELINEIKAIFENEQCNDADHELDQSGETEVNEMARKPFKVEVTEKGKKEITDAVKAMIEEEKAGKFKHSDSFPFKVLAILAKQKEPILTTDLRSKTGQKHTQAMNELLRKLEGAELIKRETSHIEPPKGEPKPKGRPKDPNKVPKEKKEKIDRLGGLIKKEPKTNEPKDDAIMENEIEEVESEFNEDNLEEINLISLSKSLINKYGKNGEKGSNEEELNERDNQTAIHQIAESKELALMQYRAGIITDAEYSKVIGLDKIV